MSLADDGLCHGAPALAALFALLLLGGGATDGLFEILMRPEMLVLGGVALLGFEAP